MSRAGWSEAGGHPLTAPSPPPRRTSPHPPRREAAREAIQVALNIVGRQLEDLGLRVSPTKTVALTYHPTAGMEKRTQELSLNGVTLPWKKKVVYLGATLDNRLCWRPHLKAARAMAATALQAIKKIVAGGRGCTPELAARIYTATGVSRVLYALPQAKLTPATWRKLELQHRAALRLCLGLPNHSRIIETLAEARSWPLQSLATRYGLNFIARLKLAPDGHTLLERFRQRPHSQAYQLLTTYEELRDAGVHIDTTIPGVRSKRATPPCALQQEVACLLHERYAGAVKMYTDGSVLPGPPGSAAAACAAPELDLTVQRRLSFASSSRTAELVGLHLAADALTERRDIIQAVILCDSRAALLRLQNPHKHEPLVRQPGKKLRDLHSEGRRVSLHWVPAHVGLAGNKLAGSLAKAAHSADTAVFEAATKGDEAHYWIAKHAEKQHPHPRLANGTALSAARTAACYYASARAALSPRPAASSSDGPPPPNCQHCGELDNTEHALLRCSHHHAERAKMLQRYAALGVACSTREELLFPSASRGRGAALTALLQYAHATGLAQLL
ncbi:hypothetical protein HPB48_026938 [Haemaphysalis longicornis]|uniref:RNase H type-1 domain-containing protein n=1 Tax=Haemaphysalis longicornis TaxID=44386 RepID=A0A9J6HBZ9_HAELO|nr:hypothetical protein HPB48_026938 [Haemaphysalis longicornis]